MPDITFNCPNCRISLKVESTAAGQEAECPDCKTKLTIPAASDAPRPVPIPPPPQPPAPPALHPPAAALAAKSTSGYAVSSLVLGILAIVPGLMCGGPIFAILGIVFSCVAQSRIKREPAKWDGRGMAVAGLVTSIVGLAISIMTILWFSAFAAAMTAAVKPIMTMPQHR